jgi:hypothetical protein
MIREPVIILGAPRSGTTMFFHTLERSSHLWSLGKESHAVLEGPYRPEKRGWDSNALAAADLTEADAAWIHAEFTRWAHPGFIWRIREERRTRGRPGPFSAARWHYLRERMRAERLRKQGVRLVEKTPKNCLRVPLLRKLFPDARFVFLRRDGRSTISSLLDGWRTPGVYETYILPEPLAIPGYEGRHWCFVLPPGWREYLHRPLEEVCAFQWRSAVEAVLAEVPSLEAEGRLYQLRYEDLTARPREELGRLFEWLKLPYEDCLLPEGDRIGVVNATSPPSPDKWKKRNGALIERILPSIADAQRRMGYGE